MGLIVLYFAAVLPEMSFQLIALAIVALYWIVVAVFIAPPMSKLLGENLVRFVFGEKGGRITRDHSRARSLAAKGKFEEALEEYRRGMEKEPENVMLRMEIAEIYSGEMKDFHAAISELEECLTLKLGATQGASILNRMADIYETNLGDIEGALAALRRIQEMWPGTKLAERARERINATGEETQNSGSPGGR